MRINHNLEIVSFTDMSEGNLYVYWFEISDGKEKLQSIDFWKKNGINGKTYKRELFYHHEYKTQVYNYEKNQFEDIVIPEKIKKAIENYKIGFLINLLTNQKLEK